LAIAFPLGSGRADDVAQRAYTDDRKPVKARAMPTVHKRVCSIATRECVDEPANGGGDATTGE